MGLLPATETNQALVLVELEDLGPPLLQMVVHIEHFRRSEQEMLSLVRHEEEGLDPLLLSPPRLEIGDELARLQVNNFALVVLILKLGEEKLRGYFLIGPLVVGDVGVGQGELDQRDACLTAACSDGRYRLFCW